MGGLGPGIGGFEILVIGLVALLVVGPKDLPVMLRKLGRLMAKARGMANDFRSSFDEMARQTELDELRKEVEALRQTQMVPLGAEAEATFREINSDLNRIDAPAPVAQPMLTGPEEFADPGPSTAEPPPSPHPDDVPPKPAKPRARATASKVAVTTKAKAPAAKAVRATTAGPAKPRVQRTKAVDL